jgi:hypothetical protein
LREFLGGEKHNENHANDYSGDTARPQSGGKLPIDISYSMVWPHPDNFCDGGKEEVCGNGDRYGHPKESHQNRGHQSASAHTCYPDKKSDSESDRDEGPLNIHHASMSQTGT